MPERPQYLTTREVADLLRVKERKVYDLAAAGEIPHRRITGKLLFPAAEITAWIEDGAPATGKAVPAVLTGSHDPLLEWAVLEANAGLATRWNGSLGGLDVFEDGEAAVAALHVREDDGWNRATVAARGLHDCVLVAWSTRSRGLLLAPAIAHGFDGIADLRGRRVVLRQPGAGAAALFDALLAQAGLGRHDIEAVEGLARTEHEAAAAIAAGTAEAAMGIAAMARQFRLGFLPLLEERFDLLIDRRAYFTGPVQRLLAFARTPAFHAKAQAMGGYGIGELGAVRWLSP